MSDRSYDILAVGRSSIESLRERDQRALMQSVSPVANRDDRLAADSTYP